MGANKTLAAAEGHLAFQSTVGLSRSQYYRSRLLGDDCAETFPFPARVMIIVGLSLGLWYFFGLFVWLVI